MKVFRALLLGGACGVGVLTYLSVVNISLAASAIKEPGSDQRAILIADNSSTPAWAAPATMNPDYKKDEAAAPAASATEEAAPPATGGEATTSYYGEGESPQNPAWAAPATMNSDYQPGATPAAAGTETAGNSTDASAPAQQPAWAAPATMNPDYKPGESAAPATPPPATKGQATTGGGQSPQTPAWAAPATMNPDYSHSAATPAAQPAATTEPAMANRDTAVEACREALDADAGSARLYFVSGSYDVSARDRSALKKIAKILKGCGNVVVEVGGHTDNTGKPASNEKLSTLRAKAVVAYLESEGVDAAKLKAVGYGQERPITTNSSAEGRRLNRRIEFFVSSR